MDIPRLQFLPGGMGVLSSTSVTLMNDGPQRCSSPGFGRSPGVDSMTVTVVPRMSSTPGRCARLNWTFPGELSAGRELRGRTGLYKADLVDRIASVCVDSDWVTSLWISPQTCVRGCFHSTLLCLLRFDGLDVVR